MGSAIQTIVTPGKNTAQTEDEPGTTAAHFLFAHGAGAPMTSPFMEDMAQLIANRGITVHRFEFDYMAERHKTRKRRPPPRAENLIEEFQQAITELRDYIGDGSAFFIGGKSMGGRIATMMADELHGAKHISGTIALGYPFHPEKKPDQLRIEHLTNLKCPALFLQGERDPLGNRDEVESYDLSSSIKIVWAPDGDHHLSPRKKSGHTNEDNLANAAREISKFIAAL